MRISSVLFLVPLLILPFRGSAQVQPPPCSLAAPGEICEMSSLEVLGKSLSSAAVSFGEALGAQLKELKIKLDKSRARVFHGNLSGAELKQAQTELSGLLTTKDYYLCLVDIILLPMATQNRGPAASFYNQWGTANYHMLADFDGNIPPFARGAFSTWTDKVEEQAGKSGSAGSVSSVVQRYTDAMQKTAPAYERYEISRDWAEYAAAGRNISNDPKQYAITLIAACGPWWRLSYATPIMNISGEYYAAMADVFGQESVTKATKTIMSAKKNRNGELEPPLQVDGVEYKEVWPALWGALGETSQRNYAVVQLAFFKTGEPSDTFASDMKKADDDYKQLIAANGEASVLRAVKMVKSAPKTPEGKLSDPRMIGATNVIPNRAIETLASGTNTAAAGASTNMVDNPEYTNWAHFKVGAVAVYGEDHGGGTQHVQVVRLQSIDDRGATVVTTMAEIEDQEHAIEDKRDIPETIAARLPVAPAEPPAAQGASSKGSTGKGRTQSSSTRGETARHGTYVPPLETGTETLKINGKVFECQWQKRPGVITWTNKDVPGGLVLYHDNSYTVFQPQLANADSIHSARDFRFEVESLSDGPYRKEHSAKPAQPQPAKAAANAGPANAKNMANPAATPSSTSRPAAPARVAPPAQPAPLIPASSIAGIYKGNYYCSQGQTGLQLELKSSGDRSITIIFTAYLPAKTGIKDPVVFELKGDFNPATKQFSANPTKWDTTPPKGYAMVGIEGAYEPATKKLSGKIRNPNCGAFSVSTE